MPLILDDDPKATGFDLQTAQTLFWRPVPVLLRQSDREELAEELNFRILTGVTRQNHNLRVLRIHISSESDLFFLHSLEVSEEDFQSLKNEQGILVDFASFPSKIITLLDKCTSAQPSDAPRFQAVLTVRGGESLFRIVETNDFKQLPHITLAFRPGNDTYIKQFLAFRLTEIKDNNTSLSDQLHKMKSERDDAECHLSQIRKELAELREQHDRHLLQVQADSSTQKAAAHEANLMEKAVLKEQYERERQELERKYREQIDALSSRLAELDADSRKLRDSKYDLDAKVSELSHRLGSAEGSNRSLEEENGRLKSQNQTLSQERHERDIALNEARAKAASLEDKVSSQVELLEQARSRTRDLETSVRQVENRCNDLRDVAAGHDARAKDAQAEVLKGNQIIEKLSNDIKLSKEKARRRAAIVQRQEEELQQRDQALRNSAREIQAASASLESVKAECGMLRNENSELRDKLEDSKQQLQSNEQMIRWLNQQVTEAQLQGTGTLPGSRYSFSSNRPSTTAALPAPASTPGLSLVSHSSAAVGAASVPPRFSASSYGFTGGVSGVNTAGTATASKAYTPTTPAHLSSRVFGAAGKEYGGSMVMQNVLTSATNRPPAS